MTDPLGRPDRTERLDLVVPGATAEIDLRHGGRVASLRLDGIELLVTRGSSDLDWGAYPMAPWAGRLDQGRFTFRGRTHRLPLSLPPHAIHGTVWNRPWASIDQAPNQATLESDLGPDWPFPGLARQRIALDPDGLTLDLSIEAEHEPMPAILGWHPWFARGQAVRDEPAGTVPVEIDLRAGAMLLRGPDGLPTGQLVEPPPPPWDDAFVHLSAPPLVRWAGVAEVEVRATVRGLAPTDEAVPAPVWVVYTEHSSGVCVEPQSGPPNGFNSGQFAIVEPGRPLVLSIRLAWQRLAG